MVKQEVAFEVEPLEEEEVLFGPLVDLKAHLGVLRIVLAVLGG